MAKYLDDFMQEVGEDDLPGEPGTGSTDMYRKSNPNYDRDHANEMNAGPVASQPMLPENDAWGNKTGSQQSQIDTFWDQATNAKRHQFSEQELGAWGVKQLSGDKYQLPNGQVVDIGKDFNQDTGEAEWGQWTIGGGQPGQNGQAMAPSAVGGGVSGGGIGGNSSSMSASAQSFQDPEIHAAIMRLLKRGETPVDEASVAGQFDPVSRQMDRGAQHTREQAAERLAFQGNNQGGSGGALDTEVNSINERNSEAKGGLMSKFITDELQGRRQDVVNALGLAQGEQKMALQLELAEIDKQIREAGLGLQSQSMAQDNQHFYDQMGYNIGRDEYLFNQNYGQGLGV